MNVPIAFLLIALVVCAFCEAAVSTKRRCVDENCTVPISLGRTLTSYAAPDPGLLSFRPNDEVKIFSKEAGSNQDLWGVELRGKRGYVPKAFIREYKILNKNAEVIVDVEAAFMSPPLPSNDKPEAIIIDGTTLYNDIAPSATQKTSSSSTITSKMAETDGEKKDTVESVNTHSNVNIEVVDGAGVEETSLETNESSKDIERESKKEAETKESNIEIETKDIKQTETIDIKQTETIDSIPEIKQSIPETMESLTKQSTTETNESITEKEELEDDDEEDDDDIEIESDEDDEEYEEDEYPEIELKPQTTNDKIPDSITTDNLTINNEIKPVDTPDLKTIDSSSSPHHQQSEQHEVKIEEPELQQVRETPPKVVPPTKLPLFFHRQDGVPPASANIDTSTPTTAPSLTEGQESEVKVDTPSESINTLETFEDVLNNTVENEVIQKSLNIDVDSLEKPVGTEKFNTPNVSDFDQSAPSSDEVVSSVPVYAEGPALTDKQLEVMADDLGNVYEPVVAASGEEKKEPGMFSSFFGFSEVATPEPSVEDLAEVMPPPLSVDTLEEVTTLAPPSGEIVSEETTSAYVTNEPHVTKLAPPSGETLSEETTQGYVTNEPGVTILAPLSGESLSEETTQGYVTNEPDVTNLAPSSGEIVSEGTTAGYVTNEPDAISIHDERKDKTIEYTTETWGFNSPKVEVTTEEASNLIEAETTTTNYDTDTLKTDSSEDIHNAIGGDIKSEENENVDNSEVVGDGGGWFDFIFGYVNTPSENVEDVKILEDRVKYEEVNDDVLLSQYGHNNLDSCTTDGDNAHCHSDSQNYKTSPEMIQTENGESSASILDMIQLEFNNTLIIVAITGACVVLFLWGFMIIEKMRKEGPLVGMINHLEHQMLVLAKENEVLTAKLEETRSHSAEINENVSSAIVEELQKELDEAQRVKVTLEEQIASLEKELESSTELGMELNKILTDVLSSQNGSDTLIANVEQLQKQLIEQQSTLNGVNDKLNEKDTENHELQLDLEITTKKVVDLQAELEKMMLNHLKAEEEKEAVVSRTESELTELRDNLSKLRATSKAEVGQLGRQLADAQKQCVDVQRKFEVKAKEYNLLREGLVKSDGNRAVVEQSALMAEVEQLQADKKSLLERLGNEQIVGKNYQSEVRSLGEEKGALKRQYEEADREKLEALTKLEVLSAYFKEKESELQGRLAKHEAMWSEKQGENTTASERLKFMQEEIQNFKSQVASLQQEIVSQEVDLKSQISVLEKKAHENWVAARQAERRVEDSRQEAAQLRNRLTLRERSLNEDKATNRNGMSPLETNGVDHHLNDTASPPLFIGARDHLTTSPPLIPGLPPGFPMPPPPGVPPPFMPPPFMTGMPPPPAMFPGDHRPPPLGRMSSPPVGVNRYTPDARAFSPYDRRSPSPTDDDYYDRYDRDYYGHRSKRNGRRSAYSSGSNSVESLDKVDRHSHSKV